MFNKEEEHRIFGRAWSMFNTVRKNPTDEGWERCISEAHEISVSIPERKAFHEKLVLAIIEEAESEEKNKKERAASYKKAGAAFQAAWKMFASFIDDSEQFKIHGMKALAEYNAMYSGRFAKKLGTAVYEAACKENNCPGAFMNDASAFYQKFQKGISTEDEAEAYAEAERIIDIHPEHTLQMMTMYTELRKRASAVA